jgi:YD repeat-containing protein
MRARSSTGWIAGRPDTTAGSQPISIIDRPTSDPPRTASLTSESPAPVPDAETLPLFTNLFPLPPVNPCQLPISSPFAAPAPSPEHNHARYDALYELTSVTQSSTTTESYTYDPVGNRLSSLGVSPYAINSSNELTSTPSTTYTYDSNGNTSTKVNSSGTTQYFWDSENRMSSVTLPGTGGTVTFKYDPFGRRIYKSSSSGTSVYAYDGDNLVEETNSAGGVVARYEQTQNIDEPLAMLRSSATSYFHADGLGSVTSLSNAAGSIHLRLVRQIDGLDRIAGESVPVHRPRIGPGNRTVLLPRQIL